MSRLFESSLTAKISNMLVEEENLEEGYCPRCGIAMQGYPATSRFDNKTEICSDCGTDEAMKDFAGETLENPNRYDNKTGKELINAVEPNRNDIAGDSEENLKDLAEAALPKEPPVRGKNERIADFIIDYDLFEFRNVYEGDNDEERRTQLITDIENDPEAAKKYVQDIADNDDRPEWRDQAEQTLKLFESATPGDKEALEARIGELRAKLADDAADDEKEEIEKEIAELEDKLNECGLNEENAGTDSMNEIKLHLEDIKKILDDEGSIDASLLKSKVEELLRLVDEHKQVMNESYSLGDDLLQNAIDSLNDLIMYADDGSLNRDDPEYSDFFKALDKAKEVVSELNNAFDKKEESSLKESTLKEDSYESGIFKDIENALYDAGFSVDRFTDSGVMTYNIGWDVSNENGSTQLQCNGSYLSSPEDDIEEAFDGTDFVINSCEVDGNIAHINLSAFGPSSDGEETEEMTRDIDLDLSVGIQKAVDNWIADHNTPDTFYESANQTKLTESREGTVEMKFDLIDAVKNCLKRYKSSFKGYKIEQMREFIKSALDYANDYFEREDFMYYINEGENLTEAYSEKLGGDPEDFISDVEEIKSKLNEINIDGFGSKLAYEIVEQFVDTCDSQIKMAKDKLNMNESVNVVTSDGSTVDTNDGASVTSNDGNVTVVTTDGTTVSINSTPEEPVMDVPVDEVPTEEPVEELPLEEPTEVEVPEEPIEEPVEEVPDEEPLEEDAEEIDSIDAKKLDVIKNQGNIYMLRITDGEGNETYWVCEDYNQETNEGNNASSFTSKEEADDNYFHRVGLEVGEAAGDAE